MGLDRYPYWMPYTDRKRKIENERERDRDERLARGNEKLLIETGRTEPN